MLLYEYEGKKLFKACGINVPQSQLVLISESPNIQISAPCVLKAQVLSGKRADAGGIIKVQSLLKELFRKTINGERVEKILVEEMVEIDKEYYLSFSYSTESRGLVLTFGEGGTGAEEKGAKTYPIDILSTSEVKKLRLHLGGVLPEELIEIAIKLWEVFIKYDCELAEINPLVTTVIPAKLALDSDRGAGIQNNIDSGSGSGMTSSKNDKIVYALDAKVILDDDADFRREVKFPERNLFGRPPTEAEIEARKIDEGDHRGTAGSVYWDLDGDIAVIAAGGGGSVVNMDALVALGGKPANYTEHSGNPPREKLKKLTEIVLAKQGLKGCWFVGGTANFTDIYETLMGFVEGLREVKFKGPIVIRRSGPNDKKAFDELKIIGEKEGFDFHIFGRETPMTATAKTIVDLAYGKEEK